MSKEIVNDRRYEIHDNHIGIFYNFFPDKMIQSYIDHFEKCNKQNLTWTRPDTVLTKDRSIPTIIDFEEFFIPYDNHEFMKFFWECYKLYAEKYDLLKVLERHTIYEMKIQKTKPSEGYHVWHTENMAKDTSNRIAVFSLYLNDVKEGGETEFLNQSVRVKPKKGRIAIWPAAFPYVHRGNPPLSGEKYILTSWMLLS